MSARPLRPLELLEQARRLAAPGTGPGRPRTVDLRSAVSRSYYALFHELTSRAAQLLVDGAVEGHPSADAYAVTRWFSHSDLLALASAVLDRRGPQPLRRLTRSASPDLIRACEAFVTLQELRHLADYDHDLDLDRSNALAAVATAEDALRRMTALRRAGDRSYALFLRLASGAVRIAKER